MAMPGRWRSANLDRPLVVKQGRGSRADEPWPLALEGFGRVEQVEPDEPIVDADGDAARACRHREGAHPLLERALLGAIDVVERLRW